jgi:ATP synthase protein I
MAETARASGSSMSTVLRVLLGQAGIGAVLAAVFWGFGGHVAGYSALLGSLACVIPNGFLALRLLAPRRDAGAKALMRAAYFGELGKLGLTVLMFSIVFLVVQPLAAGPLFAGFIAAQLMTFLGLLMRDEQEQQEKTSNTNGE